jgi:hypothetical protein
MKIQDGAPRYDINDGKLQIDILRQMHGFTRRIPYIFLI